jgi:iron complex transport system permease protein
VGTRKRILTFAVLATLVAGAGTVSLLAGKGLGAAGSLDALLSPRPGTAGHDIVWKIRLPRLLLGLLVGGGLAACGAVFQGMLRNPLADPFTLGVSGGAALGATAVRILWPGAPAAALPAGAFLGALLAAGLVHAAAARNRFTESGLILAGVVIGFLFSSLVYLLFALARPEQAQGAVLWLMGDLSNPDPRPLAAAAAPVLASVGVLWALARDLDAMTLGDEKAGSLGVPTARMRQVLFGVASLATAACVAAAGVIGFVGLLVPHLLRPAAGPGHRLLIPASALGGAALLAASDAFSRTAFPGADVPVGVVTGLLGGLFLLGLLVRGKGFRFF